MNPEIIGNLPVASSIADNTRIVVIQAGSGNNLEQLLPASTAHAYFSQDSSSTPPAIRDYTHSGNGQQTFTWVKPANLAFAIIECVGSGGSGASVPRVDGAGIYAHLGSAGSSGQYARKVISASDLPPSAVVTVGGQRTAPVLQPIAYSADAELRQSGVSHNGHTSSFGNYCIAKGGKGGVSLFYIPTNYITLCGSNIEPISGSVGDYIHVGDLQASVWFDNRHIFYRLFTSQSHAPKRTASGDGHSHYPGTTAGQYVAQVGHSPGAGNSGLLYGAGGGGAYRIYNAGSDNNPSGNVDISNGLGGIGYSGIVRITEYYQTQIS